MTDHEHAVDLTALEIERVLRAGFEPSDRALWPNARPYFGCSPHRPCDDCVEAAS